MNPRHEQWHLLSAYLDEELAPDQREALDRHLCSCADCLEELGILRETKKRLAEAPRRAIPLDLFNELERSATPYLWLGALRKWLSAPRVWMPASAFAAAIVLIGLWLGWRNNSREDYVPLESLVAAHSRYKAESLVPQSELLAANFSSQLALYYGDQK